MPKLTVEEAALSGFTHAYKLTAAEITSLGTTNQKTIAQIPPGGVCTGAAVFQITAKSGTTSDLVLDVGTTTADPDEFIDATALHNMTKAAFNSGDSFTVGGDANTGNGAVNNTASALNVVLEPTFTGTVTAGEWLIALKILDPKALSV